MAVSPMGFLTGCGNKTKSGMVVTQEAGEMTYRTNKAKNDKVSILGYGCMRWPMKKNEEGKDIIDQEKVNELIDYAIEKGVNYFDTAYIYPGSEAALGAILEKNNARDKVYIATKLPHYLIKNMAGIEKLFQEELVLELVILQFQAPAFEVKLFEIGLDLGVVHTVVVAVCFVQERQDGFSIPEVRLVALGVFLQSLDASFHHA